MKSVEDLARNDLVLLRLVLAETDRLDDKEIDAFLSMLTQVNDGTRELSDRQRRWVQDVADRLDIVEPSANLVSLGLVPRGNPVPTPEVLKHLPLKPPGRR